MMRSTFRRRTVRVVSHNINVKNDNESTLKKMSNYELLSRTRRMSEFEAPDKDFNIYTVTPVSPGESAWMCCKNSKIMTLFNKEGTVLMEIEYPVRINGVDIDKVTGSLWTSGAGGTVMELTKSSRKPVFRFTVDSTILCLCYTHNSQIIVGMPGKLVLYDLTGNVMLASDAKHNILIDSEWFPSIDSPIQVTDTASVSVVDVFLTANTGTLKPKSGNDNLHPTCDDSAVEPKFNQLLGKAELEAADNLNEAHTSTYQDSTELFNRKKSDSENRTRPLVCTPHVVRECPVTNNIATVDLDCLKHGGNGSRPFILILNNQFKEKRKCFFPARYLINDVAYDSAGNLTVADSFGSVFLLSGSGTFIRKIFTPAIAMQSYVLGVDHTTNLLWTVFKDSMNLSKVKVLKYIKGEKCLCSRHLNISKCTRL